MRKIIKEILINLLLIIFGVYILYLNWWAEDARKFLGILAFLLIGYGFLSYSLALTRMIVPTKLNFGYSEIIDKNKYYAFKDAVGAKKFKLTNFTFVGLFVVFIAVFACFFVRFLDEYELNQLTSYGKVQKIRVDEIKYKKTLQAFFEFKFNNEIFKDNLPSENYKVGDSAVIVFSTENPSINMWIDDFYLKKNKLTGSE